MLRSRSRRRIRRTRLGLRLSRFRRSPLLTLSVALTAAGLAGVTTDGLLRAAEEQRARWGELVEVAVVVHPVEPGHEVAAGDVVQSARPRDLVPADAVDAAAAVGRTALAALSVGDVVTEARLGASLVPAGWRGIGIPPPGTGAHPDVMPGDPVEVLDVAAPDVAGAVEGVVVAVRGDDGMVTVAVPRDAAARVAYAAVSGSAALALIAPRPRR